MIKKYLAYISPLEDITGKEYAQCSITFATGDLNHETYRPVAVKTDMFKYYYFGSTFEVVEMDEKKNIIDIHDITIEDAKYFGVTMHNIVALNKKNFDMQATNGVTYNYKVNKFYNYCRNTAENVYRTMEKCDKFILWAYIINGAVVYVMLDDNPKKNQKYTLAEGYIVTDLSLLRCASSANSGAMGDGNEKLNQEDIDKLITRLIS